jgi:hypothetical protein
MASHKTKTNRPARQLRSSGVSEPKGMATELRIDPELKREPLHDSFLIMSLVRGVLTRTGGGWVALLLRVGLVGFVAVVGAARVNFGDPIWAVAFLFTLAVALAGAGILFCQTWALLQSLAFRRCGYALLAFGIVGLLILSFFAQSYRGM